MTITTLDVSTLPRHAVYTCTNGTEIDMHHLMQRIRPAIAALLVNECVKISKSVVDQTRDSFGFAMAIPQSVDDYDLDMKWDDPSQFVWFVYGWGPDRDKYIANAVRKLRALLREGVESTLDLHFLEATDQFMDAVDSVSEDGSFPWGDFPWGGAVRLGFGDLIAQAAVSCYTQIEDDVVARLPLGLFCKEVMEAEGLPA